VTVLRTVVVGGGISGLTVARTLKARGGPVVLLEASDRLGGTIRSELREGFVLEAGPNGFLDRDGSVARLAEQLGIADRLRYASAAAERRAVFVRGRVRQLPSSPPRFLTSDVVPWHAKFRVLLEPFCRQSPAGVDESLGRFGRRHFGRTVTETLLDALQMGIFAGDIERLSLRAAFPRLHHMERAHRSLFLAMRAARRSHPGPPPRLASFEGGLSTLVDALGRELQSQIRTGTRVTSLKRDGRLWQVSWSGGTEQAERVVLALPAEAAAALVAPLDPSIATALSAIHYVPVSVVQLGWHSRLQPEPEGFGVLVPAVERQPILGIIFASSAFPFRAPGGGTLLTTLVGGAHRRDLAELPGDELVRTVRQSLRTMLGIDRAPDLVEIVRWPKAIPQYEIGHQGRLDVLGLAVRALPGLVLTGNAYRGPGIADCVREGMALGESLARTGSHPTIEPGALRVPGG
jgi:oxygen-dependent protoporphyrinogen oxidase